MIVELNISNFAIIDDLKINFTSGFNVLTGETGAGKSIIVEGIGLILGGRASRDLIRTGRDKASLEGLFYLEDPDKINILLNNYGIDADPNNYLLISREIHANGRSISRLNGRVVTLTMLNDITSNLVDIHGQHEHQSLLNVDNHIKLIDSFGDKKLTSLLDEINKNYKKLNSEKKKLKELSLNNMERDREIDLLRYQLDEIESANLLDYNEEECIKEYTIISNVNEIRYNLAEVKEIINSDDYNHISVLDSINKTISKIDEIKDFDNELERYVNILEDIVFQLEDLSRDMMNYIDGLEFNEERLVFLEDRLNIVNNLKKKYGNTVEEILQYKERIKNRLEILTNIEEEIKKTEKQISFIEKELMKYCTGLTNIRKTLGKNLEVLVTKELQELNMNNVVFKISHNKLDYFSPNGWDKIEFLISTNKGEDLKPLHKIISGGEMSRIMLAFKSILADADNIPCIIFDEIDSGISGRTAQIVGEKIKMISKNHQVISISHLPQIAALADTHFVIEKKISKNHTKTIVRKLDNDERIDELARLLGGVDLTNTTRLHAKEMLEMSKKLEI